MIWRIAQKTTVFAILLIGSISFSNFSLNPIVLKNRSQCAIDSKLPTRSAFLIADGYNPGRLGYNFARSTELQSQYMAVDAMKIYMKSLGHIQKNLAQKLLSGELPLLGQTLGELKAFKEISSKCQEQVYCPELNNYLRKIWNLSQKRNFNFTSIDSFSTKHRLQNNSTLGCYYLKEFSPLQSHLYGTEADRQQLQAIGATLSAKESPLIECEDFNHQLKYDHFAIQLDILTDSKDWNIQGHAFWYSLKLYTSWAFRYAPEYLELYGQFKVIFQDLDLEESLLYVSNGCESLTPPQCDSDNLTLNSLRELAKAQVQTSEFDSQAPKGPASELLTKGPRAVNNDFLSLLDYENANKWIENFKSNFSSQQWVYRNKILNAHQVVSYVATQKHPAVLASDILEYSKDSADPNSKKELLYLCTEWSLSSNKDFDFIRSDIERVSQLSFMQGQELQHGLSVAEQIEYFFELAKALKPICDGLHQKNFFDFQEGHIDWTGLHTWAKEIAKPVLHSQSSNKIPFSIPEGTKAYLTLPNSLTALCLNPADCARRVIKSAIDLYSVSTYARAFIPTGTIDSSEMFNPYNELTACEVYDPWFQKKRTRKRLMADLSNVALFGWNNIPAYIDVDFSPKRVTSFNELLEEGTLKFHPDLIEGRAHQSFLADLGPLAGAPCAVAVSPNYDKAFNFYAFGGISLNACKIKSQRKVSYKNAKNPISNTPTDRSFCGGCTLNFVGVTSAYASRTYHNGFNPLKAGVYMFRAFYRFAKGMRDPVNIPRSQTLNLNYIQETYNLYGDIPNSCVKPLSNGQRCLNLFCENAATLLFEKTTNHSAKRVQLGSAPKSYGTYAHKAQIIDSECGASYELLFNCNNISKQYGYIDLKYPTHKKGCKKKGASFL